MARPPTGQVVEREGKRGLTFAIRFRAYGERRYITTAATSREEAERELRHVLADVERGRWQPPRREEPEASEALTLHEYASRWLADRSPELKPRSVEALKWALSCHVLPFFKDHVLSEITVAEVNRYRAEKVREREQAREEAKEGERVFTLSNASINRTIAVLAHVLDTAIDEERIATNPARGKRRRLQTKKPKRTWLELDELRSLLDAAGPHRALLATMAFAGLRVGEATALRWRDVQLASSRLRVVEAKTDAGERIVDLSPDLLDELKAHKAKARHATEAGLAFTTSVGTPRDRHNVRSRVLHPVIKKANKARAEAGLPPIQEGVTNHTLRRTYASLLYEAGASPAYVQAQMGHESAALALEVYARMMRRERDTGARMDALVRGADWAQVGTNDIDEGASVAVTDDAREQEPAL